jgi:glucose-6-phosphate 1-epimerase
MIVQKTFDNGFEYIEVVNTTARAAIALQGAHLFHYESLDDRPLLWVSKAAFFATGKAIRGGIPICWPWFGKHTTNSRLPQHGFARTSLWELFDQNESDKEQTVVVLRLTDSRESLKLWPYQFELLLTVTIGRKLTIALTSKNCDSQAFTITSALHSYFAVSDIDRVEVEGLDQISYFDALTRENKVQQGNVVITRETDRVYQNVSYPLTIHDQKRTIRINARGSNSAVVWNPWQQKCAAMTDMNNDSYKTMLCVETTNALQDLRILAPGETHTLSAELAAGS